MKEKHQTNFLWLVQAVIIFGLAQAQMEAPANVPEPVITALAGKPINMSCEAYDQAVSLCIWEKFNPDRTKPSTLISFMQGKNTTNLPGYFQYGNLRSGVCGLHAVNITRTDMSTWQCTLFSETNVYRGLVEIDVVNKPEPPKFIPKELVNLVDGETIGTGGSALACYSAFGLPPPTFKWFLGDEPYQGELYPVNTTEDADGNTYTFQQLRNQHFTWRENGKKIRCVIQHHLIDDDDAKETAMPVVVRYKPRSDQISQHFYVRELGNPTTNLTYRFFANPKPRIYWEVDGVRISAGFTSPDRRMEAMVLEGVGYSEWVAVLKVREMRRSDVRRRYILKSENSVGRQDFEICVTQNPTRQGQACTTNALFLKSKVTTTPSSPEGESDDEDDQVRAENHQIRHVLHMLGEVHHQMQVLREQEAHLQNQLMRMKIAKKVEDEDEIQTTLMSSPSTTPSTTSGPDKTRAPRQFRVQTTHLKPITSFTTSNQAALDGTEYSEVKVESAGIFIRKKDE